MSDLLALAERCEAATGPDRELDAEIYHDLLGFCRHANTVRSGAQSDTGFDCIDCGADSWGNKGPKGEGLYDRALAYTASLDAAMTLEPEGLESEEIYPPDAECPVWTSHLVIRGDLHTGTGITRVLAQLASRLRARAGEQS